MWIYSIITHVGELRKGDKPEQNEGKERVVRYEKYYFLQTYMPQQVTSRCWDIMRCNPSGNP